MQLIFNELSLNDIPDNIGDGEKLIENFTKVYSIAKSKFRFSNIIMTYVNINEIEVAKNYPVSSWRNNSNTDRDIANIFRVLCDKQSIIDEIDDEIEFKFSHIIQEAKGALIACLNDEFLFSLSSHDFWSSFNIEGSFYDLKEDIYKNRKLRNISDERHLNDNIDIFKYIEKCKVNKYPTPQELLDNLDSLFPNLIFHKKAKKQLKDEVESQYLKHLRNKLYEINQYFSSWEPGKFESDKFKSKISQQSKETINRYKQEHTFEFENKEILVSWHLRYTGGIPGRIYFYPDENTGKGLICSLTIKLPTVNDPK